VYIYTVTEQADSYQTGTIAGWDEKLTYSPAEYTLRVIVKQEGAVNFIESITAQIKTKDNDGQTENTKVDPTPGASDIMFTNTYTKTKIVTDPVNESILNIGMTAAGGYANTSLYFPVSVTVTKSALETATSYKAYVVEGSTIVNDAEVGTASGTDGNGKSYYDFTSGAAKSLKLKHGQKLAFVDVSVGTTWTATDTLGSDVPYSLYTASGTANDVQLATVSKGESLSTGNLLVIETGSIAAFTNTREVVSPTGIIINNLPYIGLIVLALGAFAVFIAAGIRRRSREQAYN
jgi:hypothetical protein